MSVRVYAKQQCVLTRLFPDSGPHSRTVARMHTSFSSNVAVGYTNIHSQAHKHKQTHTSTERRRFVPERSAGALLRLIRVPNSSMEHTNQRGYPADHESAPLCMFPQLHTTDYVGGSEGARSTTSSCARGLASARHEAEDCVASASLALAERSGPTQRSQLGLDRWSPRTASQKRSSPSCQELLADQYIPPRSNCTCSTAFFFLRQLRPLRGDNQCQPATASASDFTAGSRPC